MYPFQIIFHFRIEIIKRGSAPFQNKDSRFNAVTRQDAKAKRDVCQLSKEWFDMMLPNGEKILSEVMDSEKLMLFAETLCCLCYENYIQICLRVSVVVEIEPKITLSVAN